MSGPSKKELVATIVHLNRVVHEMYAAYANDVAPDRAERMGALLKKGGRIAQPVIDRLPYDLIEDAVRAFPEGAA